MSTPNPFAAHLADGRVALAGARTPSAEGLGPVAELIGRAGKLAPAGSRFVLLRGSAVCSPLHLLAAVQGAWLGLAEGSAAARDLGGETARYLAGQRQVGRALSQAGLEPHTREVAMVLVLAPEGGAEAAGTDGGEQPETLAGGWEGPAAALSRESPAGAALTALIEGLSWRRDDSLMEGAAFDYEAYGLAPEVLERRPREGWPDLVLARCALVPLLK